MRTFEYVTWTNGTGVIRAMSVGGAAELHHDRMQCEGECQHFVYVNMRGTQAELLHPDEFGHANAIVSFTAID